MNLGIRSKLVLTSVTLLVPSLWAAQVYLDSAFTRFISDLERAHLEPRAALVQATLAALPLEEVSHSAPQLAAVALARVTLVSHTGEVVSESEPTPGGANAMENHAGRPEIAAALQGETGVDVRTSQTLHTPFLYVAHPAQWNGGHGVVRLAVPLHPLDAAHDRLRQLLLVAALLMILVALGMSAVVAQWASRTARNLTATAQRMARGDLEARAVAVGKDEFSEVARALNQLAQGLSASMAQLTAQRDLQATILDNMAEGVLLLDGQQKVAMFNPALREMLMLNAKAVGAAAATTLEEPALRVLLHQVQKDGSPHTQEISLHGLKPRVMLVRAAPLHQPPHGILAVFVDVTSLRHLESVRRDFVANASHELRTPVASIRAAAEMLGHALTQDPAGALQFVAMIERNSQRLQALVSDLLDLSRLEAQEYALEPETVALGPLVLQLMDLFRQRVDQKHLTLTTSLPPDVAVQADRRALEQVLSNLLDNATQYSPPGSVLCVRSAAHGDSLAVEVEDNGPGIEAKHLPRLFERFYRVDPGRSRETGGTGLGLSIVKHLVEAMGGSVEVHSVVGQGTRFTVMLPRAPSPAAQGAQQ